MQKKEINGLEEKDSILKLLLSQKEGWWVDDPEILCLKVGFGTDEDRSLWTHAILPTYLVLLIDGFKFAFRSCNNLFAATKARMTTD